MVLISSQTKNLVSGPNTLAIQNLCNSPPDSSLKTDECCMEIKMRKVRDGEVRCINAT